MIFFDIDNTLVDHSRAELNAASQFGEQYSDSIPNYNSDFPKNWHTVAEKHIESFLSKKITFQEQRRLRIREIFQQDRSNSEVDTLFADYVKFYELNWKLFSDVQECLSRLSGFDLGIITDGSRIQQRDKLINTGIGSSFKVILTAEESSYAKPNVCFFAEACHLANENPSDCWYIGNNLVKDALGAINTGMRGVWLHRELKKLDYSVETCDNLHSFSELVLA